MGRKARDYSRSRRHRETVTSSICTSCMMRHARSAIAPTWRIARARPWFRRHARASPVGSGCTAAVYRDAEAKQSFYDFAMNINWEAVNRVFAAFSAARSYSGGNGGGSNLGSAGSTGVTAPAVQALKKICDARRYAGISAVLHERYGLSHMMPGGVAPRARPQRDIHIF